MVEPKLKDASTASHAVPAEAAPPVSGDLAYHSGCTVNLEDFFSLYSGNEQVVVSVNRYTINVTKVGQHCFSTFKRVCVPATTSAGPYCDRPLTSSGPRGRRTTTS